MYSIKNIIFNTIIRDPETFFFTNYNSKILHPLEYITAHSQKKKFAEFCKFPHFSLNFYYVFILLLNEHTTKSSTEFFTHTLFGMNFVTIFKANKMHAPWRMSVNFK